MNSNILAFKNELKQLASKIKINKRTLKETQRSGVYAGELQFKLKLERWQYRHKHIAYCLMRGTKYEQIESKCAENNKPDQELIRSWINEYSRTENVCASA